MTPADLPVQMSRHIAVSDAGCWLWTGVLDKDGYGRAGHGARLVHRATFMALVGPIPPGMEIDHLCRVRAFCNPAHLDVVTHAENARRAGLVQRAGRAQRPRAYSLTHCQRGHEFTPENTKWRADGKRGCRPCAALRYQQRKQDVRAT